METPASFRHPSDIDPPAGHPTGPSSPLPSLAAPSMLAVAEVGVFIVEGRPADPLASRDLAGLADFYHRHGFVILRGLLPDALLDRMTEECGQAQQAVLTGAVSDRYGSTQYLDARYLSRLGRSVDGTPVPDGTEGFVNYVEHVEELSGAVREAATYPPLVSVIRGLLGADVWMSGSDRAGVVYQEARPGRESGYSRIGWHSDWQAMPSLDVWPGLAFTIHIDGTSPANGFLRVVPGSHRWATPAPYRNANNVAVPDDARPAGGYTDDPPPFDLPLGFEKIPGEIAIYVERGDVLLHDAYLWHSAARATDDEATRRHVRAGYYSGDRASYRDQFIKNAAR